MSFQKTVEGRAGEALTSYRLRFVYFDGSDAEDIKLAISPTEPGILGVLQDGPADTERATVVVAGQSQAIAGATLEPFDLLTIDSVGRVIPQTRVDQRVVGQYIPAPVGGALPDAASGDQVNILVLPPSGERRFGSKSIDFGSIATNARVTSNVTATGAALGDFVQVSCDETLAAGCDLLGRVSDTNVVTISLFNGPATYNPAAKTFNVLVTKKTPGFSS